MWFYLEKETRNNILLTKEKQDLSTIENVMEVYNGNENENTNKKIYQQLMEAKNK